MRECEKEGNLWFARLSERAGIWKGKEADSDKLSLVKCLL